MNGLPLQNKKSKNMKDGLVVTMFFPKRILPKGQYLILITYLLRIS